MSTVFYWVLNMSIMGSICLLFVLLMRFIKPLPRRAVYVLWGIPLLRLLIPVSLSYKFSLANLLSLLFVRKVELTDSVSYANAIQAVDSYSPMVYKTDALKGLFNVAGIIWCIVSLALILSMAILYIITLREVKDAKLLFGRVFESDRVTAPALYGVFRPRILVPPDMDRATLDYVVMHETAHIRRGDNFFRCVALLVCCMHWFNPLIWLSLKLYLSDMELATDACVLKGLTEPDKKSYGLSLLACSKPINAFVAAFGGAKIKVRIENILSYRRLGVASSLAVAALVIAMTLALIFN